MNMMNRLDTIFKAEKGSLTAIPMIKGDQLNVEVNFTQKLVKKTLFI